MLHGNGMEVDDDSKGPDKYEIENAARTLIEAKEIENNPTLGPLALAEVKRQMECAAKVLENSKLEEKTTGRLKKTFGE